MKRLKVFLSGVLAGGSIALGGMAYLSLGPSSWAGKVGGAMFFTVGLFAVCTFGFHLFTGKVCYVFERGGSYALDLPFIWLGNLLGAWLTARLAALTRIGPGLREAAGTLCEVKLRDSPLSILLLSAFCNILIYLAVEGFANNPHELGKYLSLFFGVTVFILCGFEHCVANMFYFSMARVWSLRTLGVLFLMTLGNAAGGVFVPLLRRALRADGK